MKILEKELTNLQTQWDDLTSQMSLLYGTMRQSKKRIKMVEELNQKRIINIEKQRTIIDARIDNESK